MKALETIAAIVTGVLALIGLATVVETFKLAKRRRHDKRGGKP